MIQRREFITLLGGAAAAWPLTARGQQGERMRQVGVLMTLAEGDLQSQERITTFQQAFQKLGWRDGRNVRIDYRWAAGDSRLMQAHAAEVVRLRPDVILVFNNPVVEALKQDTQTVPIVFLQVVDPVELGFVASLARPAGNITGFTSFEASIGGKWLNMLKEIAPSTARVALLGNPETTPFSQFFSWVEDAARSFMVEPIAAPIHDAAEIERTIDEFARQLNGALIVLPDSNTTVHRELIVAQAGKHRLPAAYPYRFFAASGGLMSYGIDNIDLYWRAASYVDRILRGEKPADLPVQQATKFELVINLKTAKALDLIVPPSLLAIADEVIE
jgi:putative ABC transport system substrate-binding protein